MIEDLFVINDAGTLLYSWHQFISTDGKDELISGFFTAMNAFASMERGEDIKSLKLKETTVIFEKDELFKLVFVATTKDANAVEILHLLVHDIMESFIENYRETLSKEFDGEVTKFNSFKNVVESLIHAYGLDVLSSLIKEVDERSYLKSVLYIEGKGGHFFYVHAKTYVNRDKISFLIPLLVNSARFLCQNNLKEKVKWILITTIKNENLLVEIREKIIIAKQYDLEKSIEQNYLSSELFKEKSRYVKKPQSLVALFEKIDWDPRIKQLYLVDLVGKIFFSKKFDTSFDCSQYVPEAISFLTSSKKTSQEIYSRELFNASIGGEHLSIVCVNFNNFALSMIGNVRDLSDFITIQEISSKVFNQVK